MRKKIFVFLILIIIISTIINIVAQHNTNSRLYLESEEEYIGTRDATIQGNDGWYYFFVINNFGENGRTENIFDGYNLKYQRMDGYNIFVYDYTEKNIKQRIPTTPSKSISEKVKNGIMEGDEVVEISNFFNKKQFNREINEEDLIDLSLEHYDKSFIIKIYNAAINSKLDDTLTKFNISSHKFLTDKERDGYSISIGIMSQRKGIVAVRIDLIYENGVYLSDLVSNNKASKKQLEIYNNLTNIGNKLTETQETKLRNKFNFSGDVYNRVFSLIEELQNYEE